MSGRSADSIIEYDVTECLPFPPGRDPAIGGLRKPTRRRVKLAAAFERYRFYSVTELGTFAPVTWLIDGYIAVGELSVLYGKGGTYKSFLALSWSCRLAHAGKPVVYIAAEGMSGMRARVAAWEKHHCVDLSAAPLHVMPSNVDLHNSGSVDTWLDAARAQLGNEEPALVVVDTLARNFVGGDENSPKDMGLFVDGVERIRRSLKTAVLVIHHSTVDDRKERGTESLRNASFAMLKVKGANNSAITIACDRMKDAEPPASTTRKPTKVALPELTISGGPEVSSLCFVWSDSSGPADAELRETPYEISSDERRILRLVGDAKRRAKGTAPAEIAKVLAIPRGTLSERLKSLVDSDFLERKGRTRAVRYFITDKGTEVR